MYTIGVIMDPIECVNKSSDSTIAMLSALQKTNKIEYINPKSLNISNRGVYAKSNKLDLYPKKKDFYKKGYSRLINLSKIDCILFRIDPPVDITYIHMTHILDYLELNGVLIINSPQSLRDFNEKLLGHNLNINILPTLVSANEELIKKFIVDNKKVVIKPLNMMGGQGIISLASKDSRLSDKIKNITNDSERFILAQKFLKNVTDGDTRILITNGIVHDHVLVRYPPKDDFRANLSYGGKYKITKINKKYKNNLMDIAEYLKNNRIYFAGVDMIGKYITEINITSPTGIQQIEDKDINFRYKIAKEINILIKEHHEY